MQFIFGALGAICLGGLAIGAGGQPTPEPAKVGVAVQSALAHLAKCDPSDRNTACNLFFCKALEAAYGSSSALDFQDSSGRCLLANEIGTVLYELTHSQRVSKLGGAGVWSALGSAADSAVLERAQACANAGYITVASSRGTGHGHVVLVVPGTLQPSGWGVAPSVAGEIIDSAGTRNERANGTATSMSLHWSSEDRPSVALYARGVHQAGPQVRNGCN